MPFSLSAFAGTGCGYGVGVGCGLLRGLGEEGDDIFGCVVGRRRLRGDGKEREGGDCF